MGLSNSSKSTYVSTFGGSFIIRAEPGDPNARRRTNKNGVEVWENTYNTLSGHITDIRTDKRERDGKTYRSLKVHISDQGTNYILGLHLMGNAAMAIMQTMATINYRLPVELSIFRDSNDRDVMVVRQEGSVVKWNYTKDNPNGKPDWKAVEINGEKKWDRNAELTFFHTLLEEKVRPRIQQEKPAFPGEELGVASLPSSTIGESSSAPSAEVEDDLPF